MAPLIHAYHQLTGFPAVLPEWGYGFWKSRDVHEHQDDVLDDFEGFRRHQIPLDAIVIDSPWATQYNTWEFNPYQFPDAPGMVKQMRADGVRTVGELATYETQRLVQALGVGDARLAPSMAPKNSASLASSLRRPRLLFP